MPWAPMGLFGLTPDSISKYPKSAPYLFLTRQLSTYYGNAFSKKLSDDRTLVFADGQLFNCHIKSLHLLQSQHWKSSNKECNDHHRKNLKANQSHTFVLIKRFFSFSLPFIRMRMTEHTVLLPLFRIKCSIHLL